MDSINFIEAVTERDVDLLLLEELSVSNGFVAWLIGQTTKDSNPTRLGVWHSLMDAEFGESDLILTYQNGTSRRHALLIENKIDATVQPEQAERYRSRGDKGKADHRWDEYKTCLVAPQKYLNMTSNAHLYDHVISYESVREWYLEQKVDPARAQYKANLMQEAIDKNRRGYTIVPDDRVTDFWFRYWQFANQMAPELEMKEPNKKPSKSSWIHFYPSTLPKNIHIVHKLEKGFVDLQMDGIAQEADRLIPEFQSWIPESVSIEVTGKSLSLRIDVPMVNHFAEFEAQREAVTRGIQACRFFMSLSPTSMRSALRTP